MYPVPPADGFHFHVPRKMSPTPQTNITSFWVSHLPPIQRQTLDALPPSGSYHISAEDVPEVSASGELITKSYKSALKECERKVAQIIVESRLTNTKYTDVAFNLDNMYDCLVALTADSSPNTAAKGITVDTNQAGPSNKLPTVIEQANDDQLALPTKSAPQSPIPACARRVDWIFDDPQFYVNKNAHVRDIRQGAEGDCWFISSLGSLCVDTEVPHLIRTIAPASCRDEQAGVYGFLFYRDGAWISEVVDDKLYLKIPDYDDCTDRRRAAWDADHSGSDSEISRKLWRQTYQSNSDALFYASCAHPQETWVPLIEKAFAKIHGDYAAIDGGWPGEGVEDLTGGITTEIVSASIADRDDMWNDCFLNVNKMFLIGAGTREYRHPDPYQEGRQGIEDGHAYSVLRAVTYDGERLVMVKNPWGKVEWTGPWSDGSKEWSEQALHDLGYKFGNEGIFWMPYSDFLERFVQLWRTRLFTAEWSISQLWTPIRVPWLGGYSSTVFEFKVTSPSPTVVALSQVDSRYYGGLIGQYGYRLSFRLHKYGSKDHIVQGHSSGDRSAVAEVHLTPGRYVVVMKIDAYRDDTQPTIADIIETNWISRREKLIRTLHAYETAQAKAKTERTGSIKNSYPHLFLADTLTEEQISRLHAPNQPWRAAVTVGLKIFCQNKAAVLQVRELHSLSSRSRRKWDWLKSE